MAGVYYHLGELELAAKYYLLAEKDSDISMYSYIKCLIDLGRTKEAKEKLDFINKGSYHLIGEIEIADLYVELTATTKQSNGLKKGIMHTPAAPIGLADLCMLCIRRIISPV